MGRLEIRPSEGGADAALFASEMTAALTKFTGTVARENGTGHTFNRL